METYTKQQIKKALVETFSIIESTRKVGDNIYPVEFNTMKNEELRVKLVKDFFENLDNIETLEEEAERIKEEANREETNK